MCTYQKPGDILGITNPNPSEYRVRTDGGRNCCTYHSSTYETTPREVWYHAVAVIARDIVHSNSGRNSALLCPQLQGAINSSAPGDVVNKRAPRATFIISLLSCNSGHNCSKHAHSRRIRRSISRERSAFLWIPPPRNRNQTVCLFLCLRRR